MIVGTFHSDGSLVLQKGTRLITVKEGDYPVYEEVSYFAVRFPVVGTIRFPKHLVKGKTSFRINQ